MEYNTLLSIKIKNINIFSLYEHMDKARKTHPYATHFYKQGKN